jgi:hypothetical protein
VQWRTLLACSTVAAFGFGLLCEWTVGSDLRLYVLATSVVTALFVAVGLTMRHSWGQTAQVLLSSLPAFSGLRNGEALGTWVHFRW